jgi:hypothetical protein
VALADSVWRGRRVDELEAKVTTILAATTGMEQWVAWSKLDSVCTEIASRGEARLAFMKTG